MFFKKSEFQDKAQDEKTTNQNKNSKTHRQTIDMIGIWKSWLIILWSVKLWTIGHEVMDHKWSTTKLIHFVIFVKLPVLFLFLQVGELVIVDRSIVVWFRGSLIRGVFLSFICWWKIEIFMRLGCLVLWSSFYISDILLIICF